ncbi:hypothetical protein CEB3_c14810 [Peptococcaceae bacterium CEB3]|nr:hypothetical protein CEB3_c14810 [Peptococcaceae bacterium CEB3]
MTNTWVSRDFLYLEYEIEQNKPGLLGAVTTLLGMLEMNIVTVASIGETRRGFLLDASSPRKVEALAKALSEVDQIRVTALREPNLLDRVALRHGKRLSLASSDPPTYRFIREELGVLVDFLGDTLVEGGQQIIGMRGMPRVGKTEAAIAACVYANKRWVLLSSTIIRQTLRTEVLEDAQECVFLIDGITSTSRGGDSHWHLLEKVMPMSTPKVIEHPDVFLRDGRLQVKFDSVIEIRHSPGDEIRMEEVPTSFSAFDLS